MICDQFQNIKKVRLSPFDLLPRDDLREKIVDLVLRGVPTDVHSGARAYLSKFRESLLAKSVKDTRVVVFGGGSGLSNIIGGDSRRDNWGTDPFKGLKEIFPRTKSIVCVTDNGGSTGELLKDLPLIAIGDIRHVLLSSVQRSKLQVKYGLNSSESVAVAATLSNLLNLRFTQPFTRDDGPFIDQQKKIAQLPGELAKYFSSLLDYLFLDKRLSSTLERPQCLGNLFVIAAIYKFIDSVYSNSDLTHRPDLLHNAIFQGLQELAQIMGAGDRAVLPCTSTPAQLRVSYTNGVEIIGEHKLGTSKRGYPVAGVHVDFFGKAQVFQEVIDDIAGADILILAPGSLYSSIIPVFKVPGLANAVRNNRSALKILIANLWVQAGETDLTIDNPERKFHVSDMIRAYEENIPGGICGLFDEVLCNSLSDIPGSVLQGYAVENKIPIYLDRERLLKHHYSPIECGVYSRESLEETGVIQHDPHTLAMAVKGLFNGKKCFQTKKNIPSPKGLNNFSHIYSELSMEELPFNKYTYMFDYFAELRVDCIGIDGDKIDIEHIRKRIVNILWSHPVIPQSHIKFIKGIRFIDKSLWNRDQRWDNVFSFFDPSDWYIKIRWDQLNDGYDLEVAVMIALGESLLGNYARNKVMEDVVINGYNLGKVYHLHLVDRENRESFFNQEQLHSFLLLSRMCPTDDEYHYTRLVNRGEGFTPPGLLMGLVYAWYVDNRLATNIEYKMSVTKINPSNLIPEQMRMARRRTDMIDFFKNIVFANSRNVNNGLER